MRRILMRVGVIGSGLLGLLIAFWLALALAYSIPAAALVGHVEESRGMLWEEGLYPKQHASLFPDAPYDNFTTYIMLNMAVQPADNPFVDALSSRLYAAEIAEDHASFDEALSRAIGGGYNADYSNYWHGYLVVLRPLLVFFNIEEIRLICQSVFFILETVVVAKLTLMKGRRGAMIGILLVFSYASMGAAQAAETLPVFFSFVLSMLGVLVVLQVVDSGPWCKNGSIFSENFSLLCLFGVVGSLTAFFDFLDNPVLTLCVPMAVYLLVGSSRSMREMLLGGVSSVAGWCLGYGLLWIGKWVLSAFVLGPSAITGAIEQVMYRSGVSSEGASAGGALVAIEENVQHLGCMRYVVFAAGFLVVLCVIVLLLRACVTNSPAAISDFMRALGLLLVGLIPYVWYTVLSNHSIIHAELMAYRSQIGALFPWLLAILLVAPHAKRLESDPSK